jgi:hypothetical protein
LDPVKVPLMTQPNDARHESKGLFSETPASQNS